MNAFRLARSQSRSFLRQSLARILEGTEYLQKRQVCALHKKAREGWFRPPTTLTPTPLPPGEGLG